MGLGTERYTAGAISRERAGRLRRAVARAGRRTRSRTGGFADEIVAGVDPAAQGRPARGRDRRGRAPRHDRRVARPGCGRRSTRTARITAGNASQITDGGSAVIVMSRAGGRAPRRHAARRVRRLRHGRRSRHGVAAAPAERGRSRRRSAKAGKAVGDVDLFEINEAFAAVGVASMDDLGITDEVVNVNGGAIALGHPIGMCGNRLALTLLHELRRRGGGIGAAALCGGGGQGDALILRSPASPRRSRAPRLAPRIRVHGFRSRALDAPWRGVKGSVFEGIARSATVGRERLRGSADRGVGMTSAATAHFAAAGGRASTGARRTTSPT